MSRSIKVCTSLEDEYSKLSYGWLTPGQQGTHENQHKTNVMNRVRVQDRNIPTDLNELVRTNLKLSEYLTRQGSLHNYGPECSLQDTSHYVISLILNMIGRILMNIPTPILTMKS